VEEAIKRLIINSIDVILDTDPEKLYGVTTGNLNKAVRRNNFAGRIATHFTG